MKNFKQFNLNLVGVSVGSFLNFFASIFFLSISVNGFKSNESTLANLLILFSFSQVLEAMRYPIIYELNNRKLIENSNSILFTNGLFVSLIMGLICSLILLSLDFLKIFQMHNVIYVAVILNSVNGLFWGIADSKNLVSFTSIAKGASNAAGFLAVYLFSIYCPENALYSLLVPPFIFQIFLHLIIGETQQFKKDFFNAEIIIAILKKLAGVFLNFLSSTTQGNIERLCSTMSAGAPLVLIALFSELSNRLSFFPRAIYSAAYAIMISEKSISTRIIRIKLFLVITIIILMISAPVALFSEIILNLFFSSVSDHPYAKVIFCYFIITSLLKLYSYAGALFLNIKGNFKSQPYFTTAFTVAAFIFFALHRESENIIVTIFLTSLIAKSSDLFFGIYATFRKDA